MSETKLKPCPFCGRRNVIKTYNNFVPALLCGDCGAMMSIPMTSFSVSYEKILAEKWNTRKPVDDVLERLEALKEYEKMGDCPKDGMCDHHNCGTCYTDSAIKIVKEVMGYD